MSTFTSATCLVTGAEGFLGAHLCQALSKAGARVIGVVLNRVGETSLSALADGSHGACRLEYGDVTDLAFLERLVNAYEVDHVFHLAAVSAVRIARANPYRAFSTNVGGTLAVLEACRRAGRPIRSVLVASSDKAYGAAEPPYYEEQRLEPVATYEASKAATEMICRAYRFEHGLPVIVTRCANLYGPGDLAWSRLVPGSCRRALRGEAPIVYQEAAMAERELLHVSDAVAAYLLLARRARALEHLEYNVGSGERAAILDVAGRIATLTGGPEPVLLPRPGSFQEIAMQSMDCARLEGLGWKPQIRLSDGLAATVHWYARYFGCQMRQLVIN